MRWCFPRIRRSSRRSLVVSSKLINDEEYESVVSQLKGNERSKERGGLAKATERICKAFEVCDDEVDRICDGFVEQMSTATHEGLREHGSAVEQLPSFIPRVPTGRELGTYLAVDMGGTNVRICAVTFHGDGTFVLRQKTIAILRSLMTSNNAKTLFDWVANMVQEFLQDSDLRTAAIDGDGAQRPRRGGLDLGFTFSHAVQQRGIDSGTLIRWSKGFDIGDAVGEDVCALLQDALYSRNLNIRVTALVNDTVGTLLTQAYVSQERSRTVAGAVFGTGTNGAYIEKASKITKVADTVADSDSRMIINSEWGNFDKARQVLASTPWDCAVDAMSVNPGFELFEKQVSGMYLGEILRLVVISLSEDEMLYAFEGVKIPATSSLYVPWNLDSSFLSQLESDGSSDLLPCRLRIQEWLGVATIGVDAAKAIKSIAHAIVLRSARLSAVALGAVLVQTNCLGKDCGDKDRISIGVDGSLIELYPGFIDEIRCALRCVEGIGDDGEARVDITITKDGSGVGAAMAALIAAESHLGAS